MGGEGERVREQAADRWREDQDGKAGREGAGKASGRASQVGCLTVAALWFDG